VEQVNKVEVSQV